MSRRRKQASTSRTTIDAIMRNAHFALGVSDARAGLPFRADYDDWDGNDQWDYERGRQWAMLAPRRVALKRRGGGLNPAALHWFRLNVECIL